MNCCSSVFLLNHQDQPESSYTLLNRCFSPSAVHLDPVCPSCLPASTKCLKCGACEAWTWRDTLMLSRLHPSPRLLPHPLHPCVLPLLLFLVFLSCLLFSHLKWGCLSAPLGCLLVLQTPQASQIKLQWGALQRLSLPGRNCAVIELLDNNTFFSLISYKRWIIKTIIIVPSHQQRSADASTPPPPELTCCFTRLSLPLARQLLSFHLFYSHFLSLSLSSRSVLTTTPSSHLSPTILPISVPFHWVACLRGIQKLQCTKKKRARACVCVEGGEGGREDN